jgi:hypothetical protein
MIDFSLIFNQTLTGIFVNAPWFILVYVLFQQLMREIPKFIESYEKIKEKERKINWALTGRNNNN